MAPMVAASAKKTTRTSERRAPPAQSVVGEHRIRSLLEAESGRLHRTLGRPVETSDEREQARLAAARGADQGHELARRDPQADSAKGGGGDLAHAVNTFHLLKLQPHGGPQQVRSLHGDRIVAHFGSPVGRDRALRLRLV
jgi:hypothetical protein